MQMYFIIQHFLKKHILTKSEIQMQTIAQTNVMCICGPLWRPEE